MAAAMPTNTDALPAGTRLGEFELQQVVGVGGFGIVYRAYDHALQRIVALKEYLPGALAGRGAGHQVSIRSAAHAETFGVGLRSFVNEARLLAQFDHPALLKVYRFWEDNGTAYMAMPFYDGPTLQTVRRGMDRPPAQDWLRALLDPVLGALEVMHREQVFHRDVAPDNIILRPKGGPVLLDLGAARRVIGDRTQMLTAIVKPNFAPLEQYSESSQMRQGPWTDLYALGAVVYFCATGSPPVPAATRALHDELVPLVQLVRQGQLPWSEAFAQVWQATLALRPTGRPQSVAALRALLDAADAPPAMPVPAVPAEDQLPTVAWPAAGAGAAAAAAPVVPGGAAIALPGPAGPGGRQAVQPVMPVMPVTVPVRRVKHRRLRGRARPDPAVPMPDRADEAGSGLSRGLAWVLLVAAPVAFAGVLWWSNIARGTAAPVQASAVQAAGDTAAAAPVGLLPVAGAASDLPATPLESAAVAALPPAGPAPPGVAASDAGAPVLPAAAPEAAATATADAGPVPAALPAPVRPRPPYGGALLPEGRTAQSLPPASAVPRATAADATSATPSAPRRPGPAAVPRPESPRAACGSRVAVAWNRCMQRQCLRPALASHPECVQWRRSEPALRGRQ